MFNQPVEKNKSTITISICHDNPFKPWFQLLSTVSAQNCRQELHQSFEDLENASIEPTLNKKQMNDNLIVYAKKNVFDEIDNKVIMKRF